MQLFAGLVKAQNFYATGHNTFSQYVNHLQALTPLVSLVTTATMIGSEWLEIPIGLHLSAFLSLGMTLLTFTNPLVAMIFVGPYRQGLLKLLGIRSKAPVTPEATAESVTSTVG